MKLSWRYTDKCLNKVDGHIDFNLRHAQMNPRFIADHECVYGLHWTYKKNEREFHPPIDDHFVLDRQTGKQIVIFPYQFFKTDELQMQARNRAVDIAVTMQQRYAVFRKVA